MHTPIRIQTCTLLGTHPQLLYLPCIFVQSLLDCTAVSYQSVMSVVNGQWSMVNCQWFAFIWRLYPKQFTMYASHSPFIHTFTHQQRLAAMQGTNQLVRSNWGLGVLLRDTSTHPGWDVTCNPPTARRQLLPPDHHIIPMSCHVTLRVAV